MIDIAVQRRGKTLVPFSQEDLDALSEYRENQVLRAKLTGAEKPRSYQQLKLYWSCCRTVAENLDNMLEKDVDFEVKIQVAKRHPGMIRRFKSVDGVVYMEPISIASANMKLLEACEFFKLAWPIMAEMIGVTKDELLKNANREG